MKRRASFENSLYNINEKNWDFEFRLRSEHENVIVLMKTKLALSSLPLSKDFTDKKFTERIIEVSCKNIAIDHS